MSVESISNIANDQDPGHARPGEKPNEATKQSRSDVFADLDNLRLSTGDTVRSTEMLTHIPVRKPKKTEFFRVNPDSAYRLETMILEDPETRDVFLVAPSMRGQLGGEGKVVRLIPAITAQGALLLWPLALPDPGGLEMPGGRARGKRRHMRRRIG
jgi:hypothetical protein